MVYRDVGSTGGMFCIIISMCQDGGPTQSGASLISLTMNYSCALCGSVLVESKDRYSVTGRSSFKIIEAIEKLPFRVIVNEDSYVCRRCFTRLKKKKNLEESYDKCLKELREIVENALVTPQQFRPANTSTPTKAPTPPPLLNPPVAKINVSVCVKWPSQTRSRNLLEELEPLGKALVRGTFSQIANAAFKCKHLKMELVKCVLRDMRKELVGLCSRKNPSKCRPSSPSSLINLTVEDICLEWSTRAPIFYSFLVTASVPSRREDVASVKTLPSVAVAGSVLLRERCKEMNALQHLISMIIKFSPYQTMFNRLNCMRLVLSNSTMLRRMDDFAKIHDVKLLSWKTQVDDPTSSQSTTAACDEGQTFVIDNLDLRQNVSNMTEENQNLDYHWVNANIISNRVSGNHLPDNGPIQDVMNVEISEVLPSPEDHLVYAKNLKVHIQRILVSRLPCLEFLKECVVHHLPHPHQKEMHTRSKKIALGLLFHDENTTDGITKVIEHLQQYLDTVGEGEDVKFIEQGLVGDQLTVERCINAAQSRKNGYDAKERLEGFHWGVADWHTGMKACSLAYKHLYSAASAGDQCTLHSDRNLINRRNVKMPVDKNYSNCKKFLMLEVDTRVACMGMHVLGMTNLSGDPQTNIPPKKDAPDILKKIYLHQMSNIIYENYVSEAKKGTDMMKAILEEQEVNDLHNRQPIDENRRYRCRFVSCDKTFAKDGKRRRDHEASHTPPVQVEEPVITSTLPVVSATEGNKKQDDMYNYNICLTRYGLLCREFYDAIREGDGQRILRCWKFFLLHFKADERGSTKYALEALYLILQVKALLSPRQAYRLLWNRTVHGKDTNIPLDLDLEHDNRMAKDAIRKLGHNINEKSVTRIFKAQQTASKMLDSFDNTMAIMKRSGRHGQQSDENDFKKIVGKLMEEHALSDTEGRAYNHYSVCKSSMLDGANVHSLYAWIKEHQKNICLHRRSR